MSDQDGSAPVATYSPAWIVSHDSAPSIIEMSQNSPAPVDDRRCSAEVADHRAHPSPGKIADLHPGDHRRPTFRTDDREQPGVTDVVDVVTLVCERGPSCPYPVIAE